MHWRTKVVFWCGGDIVSLRKRKWAQWIFKGAINICENEREQKALADIGIESKIEPGIVDSMQDIPVSFTPSKTPHVYIAVHPSREKEYGLRLIEKIAPMVPDVMFHVYGNTIITNEKNIFYHGKVSDEWFNDDIKNYQAALRLNTFEGFSEILAKSAIMGQYPISVIPYPHITHVTTLKNLIDNLNALKKKRKPNLETREYWMKQLSKSLEEIVYE